jgi:acyl-CoA thioesterase-1
MESLNFHSCWTRAAGALLALAVAAGCGNEAPAPAGTPQSVTHSAAAPQPGRASATDGRPRVVFLGDSLTAGLGLSQAQAFPALIGERLGKQGYAVDAVNAGISGDTSAGGRRRLDWALDGNVRVLVLALGANDGLRGNPVADMKQNLQAIIRAAKGRGIEVLLLGMEAPPNFGPEYTKEFRAAFRELADEERVAFVPFFLDGVAGVPALNQGDGLHPNAQGAERVADTVWKALEPLVAEAAPAR